MARHSDVAIVAVAPHPGAGAAPRMTVVSDAKVPRATAPPRTQFLPLGMLAPPASVVSVQELPPAPAPAPALHPGVVGAVASLCLPLLPGLPSPCVLGAADTSLGLSHEHPYGPTAATASSQDGFPTSHMRVHLKQNN